MLVRRFSSLNPMLAGTDGKHSRHGVLLARCWPDGHPHCYWRCSGRLRGQDGMKSPVHGLKPSKNRKRQTCSSRSISSHRPCRISQDFFALEPFLALHFQGIDYPQLVLPVFSVRPASQPRHTLYHNACDGSFARANPQKWQNPQPSHGQRRYVLANSQQHDSPCFSVRLCGVSAV
jgi:hypothetical protein